MQALNDSHQGLEETKAQLEAEKLRLNRRLLRSTSSLNEAEESIKVGKFHCAGLLPYLCHSL